MVFNSESDTVLLKKACDKFVVRFSRKAVAAASAPGRVNLIGDHIDYCGGFVLPAAVHFSTVVVGSYNGTSICNIISFTESGQELETSFVLPVQRDTQNVPGWARYILGVIYNFPGDVAGFDAVIVSNVPMGSGVSSSAALEVSSFTFLEALTSTHVDPVKKALSCQKAEHDFADMPCGIMDQFISTLGKRDQALLIDCRSLESTHIPISLKDITILVINSNVKHQLTGSEYPLRRAQCQRAAELMGKTSLREANFEDLDKLKQTSCDVEVLRRAEHVISEIHRTEDVAKLLKDGCFQRVGELFFESHESLSKLMEVSCPEVDQLVSICRAQLGVLGARMTGGGFGGCVVTLVKKMHVEDLKNAVKSQYAGNPSFFECKPSDGARIIRL